MRVAIPTIVAIAILASSAAAREWKDSTGRYSVEAELIAFDAATAVLLKEKNKLVSVTIAHLSEEDRKFIESKLEGRAAEDDSSGRQTWTLKNGLKVEGRVVAYGRRDLIVQRKRGRVYANDQLFTNLPAVYQKLVPRVVGHFEMADIQDKAGLEKWAIQQKGQPRRFTCEGVMLELENGDQYAVPFFFFSADDLKVLQPGWDAWASTDADSREREQANLYLEAQSHAFQQHRQQVQQVTQLQLELLATDAGVTDMWEVQLVPKPGVNAFPQLAIVSARDSRAASAAAALKYPNYVPAAVQKLR